MTSSRPSEFELIARYFAPMAGEGALGLLDDAAVLRPPAGHELVLTKDVLVAGVHFFPDDPWDMVARKALRVNLSDLAAKGAAPLGFLLGLALPADWSETRLAVFADGLADDARLYGCPLLGGDTVKSSAGLTVSITVLGSAPLGGTVRRLSAEPGDCLFVTGTIGDAALGLAARLDETSDWLAAIGSEHLAHLLDRYLLPRPRSALGDTIQRHARAGMDISDGFVGDLQKMLAGSGTSAVFEMSAVPFSSAVRAAIQQEPALLRTALTGGDDYELLCAVPFEKVDGFTLGAEAAGVAVTQLCVLGEAASPPVVIRSARDIAIDFGQGSFSHF